MEKGWVVWKKILVKNWWTTNFVMVMTIVVDGLPWQSTYQVRMHCVFPTENSWLILLLLLLLITKRVVVVLLSDGCWLVWTAQNDCLFLISCVFADVVLLHRCSVLCSASLGAWHTTNTKKWNGTVVDVVVAFCGSPLSKGGFQFSFNPNVSPCVCVRFVVRESWCWKWWAEKKRALWHDSSSFFPAVNSQGKSERKERSPNLSKVGHEQGRRSVGHERVIVSLQTREQLEMLLVLLPL